MPFRLFSVHRKSKKDTSDNITSTELSNGKSEEHINSDNKTDKNRHHFFPSFKSSSHVHFKDTKTDKAKKVKASSLFQCKRAKSLTHIPNEEKESHTTSCSTEQCGHPDNRDADSKRQPRGSASYGAAMDTLGRTRRLLEIAQLDNYMEYLRHTEDEGNLTNRLCCAQVLKLGLLRLEQSYQNSQERINDKASTNHKHSPVVCLKQYVQKNKQMKDKEDVDDDQSSSQSDNKDDDRPACVTFSCAQDSDGRESEHDSSSEPDSEDCCQTEDKCNNTTFKIKTSAVWPQDIEIF